MAEIEWVVYEPPNNTAYTHISGLLIFIAMLAYTVFYVHVSIVTECIGRYMKLPVDSSFG